MNSLGKGYTDYSERLRNAYTTTFLISPREREKLSGVTNAGFEEFFLEKPHKQFSSYIISLRCYFTTCALWYFDKASHQR